jgi:hypothetical protein
LLTKQAALEETPCPNPRKPLLDGYPIINSEITRGELKSNSPSTATQHRRYLEKRGKSAKKAPFRAL